MTRWLIGAYGADMDGTSEGISMAQSRPDGSLEVLGVVAAVPSPTFLAQAHGHVYAALEGSHRVVSFRHNGESLTLDGDVASGGVWPCQLELIEGAVVVANYGSGTIGVVGLVEGRVSALVQVLEGEGSGPHPAQDGPHAHASFRLNQTTLLSADLGADRILVHQIERGVLRRTTAVALPPGTGPRDIARHPSGLIYVLGEHGNSLTVLEWVNGELQFVSSVVLPGVVPADQAAAIAFGPGARFVYAGLRGSNQIAVLRASDDGRELTPVGTVSTEGDWPRHLVVVDDLLHVANQRSNTVASFQLGADGLPRLITTPTVVASPTYLLRLT